jgi:DNA gyrase/topoisomerase IV subunit A
LVASNKNELSVDDKDPLKLILSDLGDIPPMPPADDETEIQLNLSNRFPPQLSKLDKKKNLKAETIDDAIKIMQKIPGFSGDTFLEIFVRMKLHCQKNGEAALAKEVNNVIANLQNLAKHGLVKPDNGFNSFLKDIQAEVVARGRRKQEHLKEIERLQKAIKELDEQKDHMDKKINDMNAYLDSVRKKAAAKFVPLSQKFKYKDLEKQKVIAESEIPTSQQGKVKFVIEQKSMETFHITGKIKGLPGFTREFDLPLETLLTAKETGTTVFDTEKGLELNVASTILFLNKHFFSQKK